MADKKDKNVTEGKDMNPIEGAVLDKDGTEIVPDPADEKKELEATPVKKEFFVIRGFKAMGRGIKAFGRGVNNFRRKHPFWTGVGVAGFTGIAVYAGKIVFTKFTGGDPEEVEIEIPEIPVEAAQEAVEAVTEAAQEDWTQEEFVDRVMTAVQDKTEELVEEGLLENTAE